MTEALWTLDELTERVGDALSVGYDGQPSGRVRHLPDQRAIRWYTTIGLVDRPAATRGRTAMYGPRHLLQLVAIKRLQAQGLSLVAIQAELAGATDTQLARVAQLPQAAAAAAAPEAAAPPAAPAPPLRRPTVALHASPPVAPAASQAATPAGGPTLAAGPGLARQARFWRERPAEAAAGAAEGAPEAAGTAAAVTAVEDAVGTPASLGAVEEVQTGPAAGDRSGAEAAGVAILHGVRLGEGATLLLEPGRPLDDADLRAVLDAARPLLRALRARGLDHPRRELP
jgi:MerR HTH family regulatory protein